MLPFIFGHSRCFCFFFSKFSCRFVTIRFCLCLCSKEWPQSKQKHFCCRFCWNSSTVPSTQISAIVVHINVIYGIQIKYICTATDIKCGQWACICCFIGTFCFEIFSRGILSIWISDFNSGLFSCVVYYVCVNSQQTPSVIVQRNLPAVLTHHIFFFVSLDF